VPEIQVSQMCQECKFRRKSRKTVVSQSYTVRFKSFSKYQYHADSPFHYTLIVGIYLCGQLLSCVDADVGKVKFREEQCLPIVRRVVESL
jgi:hypothetical protein